MCCCGGEGAFLFCTLLLKQIPWAWNIKLFHPKHPCLGTRKNPSCVPYFCHSSQAKHPYFGPQHPSKSRSVTDGVCELVHFQQRGLRGKKNSISMEFQIFHVRVAKKFHPTFHLASSWCGYVGGAGTSVPLETPHPSLHTMEFFQRWGCNASVENKIGIVNVNFFMPYLHRW